MPDSSPIHGRLIRVACIVLGALVLAAAYGPAMVGHIKFALNPYVINDDARQQIWPMLEYRGETAFAHDEIARYYLDCLPVGYQAVYRLTSVWWDPRDVSKLLPYAMWLATLAGVATASRRLSGGFGAWFSVALCLGAGVVLERCTGGLPRGFGFPILAWMAAALVYGRADLLLALTACAGAFYPVTGVIGGAMSMLLLVLPGRDRGQAATWSWRRRGATLALVGALAVLGVWPAMQGTKAYGRAIGPHDLTAFPEAGPGGRYDFGDYPPYPGYAHDALAAWTTTLMSPGRSWGPLTPWLRAEHRGVSVAGAMLTAITLLAGSGVILRARDQSEMRRLLTLALASAGCHIVADVLAPKLFLPNRYALYPVAILAMVLVPAGILAVSRLAARHLHRPVFGYVCASCLTLLTLAGVGAAGDTQGGYRIGIDQHHALYPFLASLPDTSVIAGWPTGAINNVPYFTGRRILLSYETHQAFHVRYTLDMRQRMEALLAALTSTDPQAARDMAQRFGVTHVIVEREYLIRRPAYFKPFDGMMNAVLPLKPDQPKPALLTRPGSVVYRQHDLFVVDLAAWNAAEQPAATRGEEARAVSVVQSPPPDDIAPMPGIGRQTTSH
ncbi:MAG: hypothetical protein IT440_04305 [Phycisphaeraceae bacterium]|nr:hypothetical protein [Phycisphaeraceae bacterium]